MDRNSINRKEVYRYLGYRNISPDEKVDKLIEEVINETFKIAVPKFIMQRCLVKVEGQSIQVFRKDQIKTLLLNLTSKNLADNLFECEEVILFAATLGVEVESYVKKQSIINMAKAGVAQSVLAAMIEAFCNEKQEEIRKDLFINEGLYLRPRFSPGYGDLKLETQRDFFNAVEITKRLGISLTDSCLMFPTKSVTAFIGITSNEKNCHISKCKACENKECEFRNEDAE